MTLLSGTFADCPTCGRTMNGTGCADTYEIAGQEYERIPYGDPRDRFPESPNANCSDCNAPRGGLHHGGCCVERCPRCLGQSIGCDCEDEDDEETE